MMQHAHAERCRVLWDLPQEHTDFVVVLTTRCTVAIADVETNAHEVDMTGSFIQALLTRSFFTNADH